MIFPAINTQICIYICMLYIYIYMYAHIIDDCYRGFPSHVSWHRCPVADRHAAQLAMASVSTESTSPRDRRWRAPWAPATVPLAPSSHPTSWGPPASCGHWTHPLNSYMGMGQNLVPKTWVLKAKNQHLAPGNWNRMIWNLTQWACQPWGAQLRFDFSIHLSLLQGDPAESNKALFVYLFNQI